MYNQEILETRKKMYKRSEKRDKDLKRKGLKMRPRTDSEIMSLMETNPEYRVEFCRWVKGAIEILRKAGEPLNVERIIAVYEIMATLNGLSPSKFVRDCIRAIAPEIIKRMEGQ